MRMVTPRRASCSDVCMEIPVCLLCTRGGDTLDRLKVDACRFPALAWHRAVHVGANERRDYRSFLGRQTG